MKDFVFNGTDTVLPEGVYRITDTITLTGTIFRGAGIDKTILVADFDDPKKAIFHAGWLSKIEDMTVCFKDGLVCGDEGSGERVAFYTKAQFPLQKCAYIKNVKIDNVGTGILANDFESTCFSVHFENITVTNFSFRGFDISSPYRTGNIYSNIYISSGKYRCDSAFYFGYSDNGEEESETTLENLRIYDTRARIPLELAAARGFIAQDITLHNVEGFGGATVYLKEFAGCIGSLTVQNSPVLKSIIKIGATSENELWHSNHVRIKSLNLKGLSNISPSTLLFEHENGKGQDYFVRVEDLTVTDCDGGEVLENFPVSEGLIFTKKGEPINESRLCRFYSIRYDEEIGRETVWNGTEWC